MKKSLIAAAVLASLSGIAAAQSSVTLYGTVDVSIQNTKNNPCGGGANSRNDKSTLCMVSGSWSGNRWGIRGSEDLGGGLSAIFQLENGFSTDTGAFGQGTAATTTTAAIVRQFGRQAYVGLKGGFGQFSVGRQYALADELYWATGPFNQALGASGGIAGKYQNNDGPKYDIRIDNSLKYISPKFADAFSFSAMYSLGSNLTGGSAGSGDEVAGDNAQGRYAGLSALYASGPIWVSLSYDTLNSAGAADAAITKGKSTTLLGRYTFGFGTLGLGFESFDSGLSGDKKDTSLMFGAVIPVLDKKADVGFQIAQDKDGGNATTASAKVNRVALSFAYKLSARTEAYTGYAQSKSNASGAKVASSYGVGVRHRF